jgi:hypothetical protein
MYCMYSIPIFKTCLANFQDCLKTTGIEKKTIHVSTHTGGHMIQSGYTKSFLAAQNRF